MEARKLTLSEALKRGTGRARFASLEAPSPCNIALLQSNTPCSLNVRKVHCKGMKASCDQCQIRTAECGGGGHHFLLHTACSGLAVSAGL